MSPPMRTLATLGAFTLMAAGAVAQAPRVQDMPFGGGAHFEFLIPVQAKGRIFAQAAWDANVSVEAALYGPDRAHPVRITRGMGLVQISQEVTSWRAGEHWLLKLTAQQDAPDLQGQLHIVWPAGNWPLNVVRWQNAGPLDSQTRLALREGIGRLNEALAVRGTSDGPVASDPVARADLRRLSRTLTTRLEVLEQVPDRYIVNDVDPSSMAVRVGTEPVRTDQALQASLLEVVCLNHKPWHTHGESDDPFVVAAFLSNGSAPSIARTKMFEAVHNGDAPLASASGEYLLRAADGQATHLALALFEGEGNDPDASMERFQRAVELYQLYSALNGGHDPSTFAWLVAITSEGVNDVLGTPRLIAIVPDTGSLGPTTKLAFDGHGARYEVAVRIQSR